MRKILLFVAILLVASGATFGVLFLLNGNGKDYAGASEVAMRIVGNREAITGVLKDGDSAASDFLKAYAAIDADLSSLRESSAMKDVTVSEKIGEIEEAYKNITAAQKTIKVLSELEGKDEINDEVLALLKSSENAWLIKMAEDVESMRSAVADFEDKYSGETDETELSEAFDEIEMKRRDLAKKYSDIKIGKILDGESKDFDEFFDKIEELNTYLNEKK